MALPSNWQIPAAIRIRFGDKRAGKQRAMMAEGHLLLILHKVPTSDMNEREPAFFWRKPKGEWESTERGQGLFSLQNHLEEYEKAEERFDTALKKATDAEDYFQILQELGPVVHAARNLHLTLQSARESIKEDRNIIDFRDQAYDLQRTLDLLYADTRTALDFYMARKSEEQIRQGTQSIQSEQRLNILAAIFFPITAIAGIFGMNLTSGLEDLPTVAFWAIFGAGLLLGFITRGWVKKKS
ncbi:MAG: hypothetical protein JXR76_08500 [Deltaproteobacteria bacterium]|nr:hypothetical protein [Deltaproteobacteria bacterium]